MPTAPFVESVFHPSDFSEASHAAFAHALAFTLYRQGALKIVHVVQGERAIDTWTDSPRVRRTLERWGVLEPGSPRSAVPERLSLAISKINVRSADPLGTIIQELDRTPTDLIVLSTEGRGGMPRWMGRSLAEEVARHSKTMTLFVPSEARPFVSAEDGSITLKRILLPVDHRPDAGEAIIRATRLAVMSHEDSVEVVLLRVGDEADWPALDLPELETCRFTKLHRPGPVVDQIAAAAEELGVDLIVMATEGRRGIFGALKGSVTEQVLRRAECPLLAVPATR
jgi:nucleotide-binding universal stress UspA family protein